MKTKRILAIVVTLVMVFTGINVFPNMVKANEDTNQEEEVRYEYVYSDIPDRTVSINNGVVKLSVEGKTYELAREAISARCDKYGTCWIWYDDDILEFASYEVDGAYIVHEIGEARELILDNDYVVAYIDSEGKKCLLPTIEEIREILQIPTEEVRYEYVYTDIPNRTVIINDGVVKLSVEGKTYKLAQKALFAKCDKYGTCWIWLNNDSLEFVSYELDGADKNHEIGKAIEMSSDNDYAVSYVDIEGNECPLPTIEEIRKLLEESTTENPSEEEKTTEVPKTEDTSKEEKPTEVPKTEDTSKKETTTEIPSTADIPKKETPTEVPTTENVSNQGTTTEISTSEIAYKECVKVSKKKITWYNSKGAKVASATLNNGKLKYGKITASKVSDYGFIKKYKVFIFKMKNGNWYTVNMGNKKVNKMSGKIKSMNKDSQNFVVSVTMKNGKKKDVRKLKVTKGKKLTNIKK